MTQQKCCEAWIAQKHGHGRASHLFFEGPTIYSYGYHFPMATLVKSPEGLTVALCNSAKYSITTTSQQNLVIATIIRSHIPCFTGPLPRSGVKLDLFLQNWQGEVVDQGEQALRARLRGAYLFQEMLDTLDTSVTFCNVFRLQNTVQVPEDLRAKLRKKAVLWNLQGGL